MTTLSPAKSTIDPRLRRVLLVFGIWTLIGSVFTVNYWMASEARGESTSFLETAAREMPLYLLWAVLTFPLAVVVRRHPLGRKSWYSVGVHVGSSLLFSLTNILVYLPVFAMSFLLERARGMHGEDLTYGAVFVVAVQLYLPYSMMLYWATAAAQSALHYRERLRKQEVQASALAGQLSAARLDALKMQLQPHFLFNTLHSVGALARSGRSDEVVSVVTGLSDLLRRVLAAGQASEVTLAEELRFVDRYLEIEGLRFQDRLVVARELDPASLDALVPSLILQPLVENAMRHAIEADADAGRLLLRSRRDGDQVVIEVEDDGPGPGAGIHKAGGNEGIGLANVRARLAEFYGDAASLELVSAQVSGTLARLRLPWRTE